MIRQQRATILRRVKRSIADRFRWFKASLALAFAGKTRKRDRERALNKLQRRSMDRAQWRRWYQADQYHKRQLRSLRRMGVRVAPGAWNIPRHVVP